MIKLTTRLAGAAFSGLDRFEREIQDKVVLSGVAAMARVVYDEVKLNTSGARATGAPGSPPRYGDGTLNGAVYRVYAKDLSSPTRKVYRVSVNKSKARHWFLVEYGSSRAPAHPYIRPALSRLKDAAAAGKAQMAKVMP